MLDVCTLVQPNYWDLKEVRAMAAGSDGRVAENMVTALDGQL